MKTEENWLAEIISNQKRAVILSITFLVLTIASFSTGLSLFWYEPKGFVIRDPNEAPLVVVPDYTGLAFGVIATGILLLIGGVYLWQFYTPTGVQNQLHDLQELMSATMKTRWGNYQFNLPDGLKITVKYAPYRWAAQSWCGFQLQYSLPRTLTDAMNQEALRGGFSIISSNALSTNCTLEEFFPRTLLLYKTIQRIRQLNNQNVPT